MPARGYRSQVGGKRLSDALRGLYGYLKKAHLGTKDPRHLVGAGGFLRSVYLLFGPHARMSSTMMSAT